MLEQVNILMPALYCIHQKPFKNITMIDCQEELIVSKTTHIYVESITSLLELDEILLKLATKILPRCQERKLSLYGFNEAWLEFLPDTHSDAVAFLVKEAKKYLSSVELTRQGTAFTIEADSNSRTEDVEFFDEITKYLFGYSKAPYVMTHEICEHPAITVTTEEIVFKRGGEVTVQIVSQIAD